MAVKIKKMVDAICSLTVLELCKLVKALRDKFGLRTSARVGEGANEVVETEAVVEEPTEPEKESKPVPVEVPNAEDVSVDEIKDAEADEVADGSTEVSEESTKSEEESKPVPDPSSIEPSDEPGDEPIDEIEDTEVDEVADGSTEVSEESTKSEEESKPVPDPLSVEPSDEPGDGSIDEIEDMETEIVVEKPTETAEESNEPKKESKPVPDPSSVPDPGPSSGVRNPSPVKRPEVEDFAFVYAWRYSGDKRYAKIGKTTKKSFYSRFVKTYHPTDDPILIGIFKCNNESHALAVETDLLQKLERTRPDVQGHEWVEIDEAFNKMIDNSFLSDPNELEKIFGSGIKTEKL